MLSFSPITFNCTSLSANCFGLVSALHLRYLPFAISHHLHCPGVSPSLLSVSIAYVLQWLVALFPELPSSATLSGRFSPLVFLLCDLPSVRWFCFPSSAVFFSPLVFLLTVLPVVSCTYWHWCQYSLHLLTPVTVFLHFLHLKHVCRFVVWCLAAVLLIR